MKLRTENHDYARALRAIGQDLADLVLHSLELEVVGKDFIVRGQGRGAQLRQAKNASPGIWRRFQDKTAHPATDQPAPPFDPFERRYTPDDVNRLDEAGLAYRRGPATPPDISGFAEKLRTIGRILEVKRGRLVKLIDDMNSVTVEYCDGQGESHSEKYSMLALYKIQQTFYRQRGAVGPDVWRGLDR